MNDRVAAADIAISKLTSFIVYVAKIYARIPIRKRPPFFINFKRRIEEIFKYRKSDATSSAFDELFLLTVTTVVVSDINTDNKVVGETNKPNRTTLV